MKFKKENSAKNTVINSSYTTSRSFKLVNLCLCLIVSAIVFFIIHLNLLQRVELYTLDLRYKLRGNLRGSSNIAMIDIDEGSIKHIGRWPWSREWHAGLITALSKYKPKIIAFDMFFSEPSPLIDFFLVESTRLAKNVFYALAFNFGKTRGSAKSEISVLKRFEIPESQIIGDKKNIVKLARPIFPLPDLYNVAAGAGHVVAIPDTDGAIRRVSSVINCNDKYYLAFALEIAASYLGVKRRDIRIILGRYIDLRMTREGRIRIPIDKNGKFLVNWTAPWGHGFKHYPFWKVVSSYQKELKGGRPLINLNEFRNKICLVGLTATGLIDIKPIPLQPAYPIVGLHANVIDTILQKRFIDKAQLPVNLFIVLVMAILVGFSVPKFRPVEGVLLTIGIIVIYLLISFLLFKFFGLWVNVIYPVIAIILSSVSVTVHSEVASAIEKGRLYNLAVEDGLTKLYVVRHFKEILSLEMAKAQRYKRPLSIIISDIDHFKAVNDTYGHLAGDFVLKEAANVFKSTCREGDIAGRYGGEEFIILLPETDREGGVEFAERLRKLIEGLTLEYNNIKLNITISFGVAEFNNEISPAGLIKRADEALYVAKETGRNKVCFS